MGISAGGGGGGPKSDINMTPLVDVVLVLLIIFLVTMPVMMRQITLEVPRKIDNPEMVVLTSKQIVLTYRPDGTIAISDGSDITEINRIELREKLRPILEELKTSKVVFIDIDDNIEYGEAISVMDDVKGLGGVPALKTVELGKTN